MVEEGERRGETGGNSGEGENVLIKSNMTRDNGFLRIYITTNIKFQI